MEFGTILIVVGLLSLFVLEVFFEVAFFSLLGTSIRWLMNRNRRKFSDLYNSSTKMNLTVGFISFAIILTIPIATFALLNN